MTTIKKTSFEGDLSDREADFEESQPKKKGGLKR